MKKICIIVCILCMISIAYAQKKKNKHKEIIPISLSDLPVSSSETLEPLSVEDLEDEFKIQKWKDFWKFSGLVELKVSQTQLINWAAGGNSNFTSIAFANLLLNYKKNKIAWDNNLDTDFGAIYSSDFNSYRWRKGKDKINFFTSFGYEISKSENAKSMLFIAAAGSFKSQYMPGYNYSDISRLKVSNWLSPSYTELSIGIKWKWTELVALYYSPIAGLITTCTDAILRPAYGVPDANSVAFSLGMTFQAGIVYNGVKNLKIMSNLQFYTPYTDKDQKFGSFNVDWDVIISYQFLKLLNVSLTTNVKYYPKILFEEPKTKRVQFQQIFGLGVAYRF